MITVNEEKCVGCSLCLPVCPQEAIEVWVTAKVKGEACTECGDCVGYCPTDALEVPE